MIPATLALSLAACFGGGPERPDLGAVLDRTIGSLGAFQRYMTSKKATSIEEKDWQQLSGFMGEQMNKQPAIYPKPVGITLLKDAKFEGFVDTNRNKTKDAGEDRIFTVEVDIERKRLIATDEGGQSVGSGLARAGTGFLAGMVIGSLLSRQRGAGVKPSSFANRKVSSRSSYKSPRGRSGGIRRGK